MRPNPRPSIGLCAALIAIGCLPARAWALAPAGAKTAKAAKEAPGPLEISAPEPEPWSKHFSVTEVTPAGHKVRLQETKLHLVDLRSRVIIQRTSATPSKIQVRSGDDEHEAHFGVKVEVRRPHADHGGRPCKSVVAVPGLNRPASVLTGNIEECPGAPTTFNVDVDVTADASFEIDTSLLQHGDQILVRLLGEQVGTRTVPAKEGCETRDVRLTGERSPRTTNQSTKVCPATEVAVPGTEVAFTLLAVDYYNVRPYEKRKSGWEPLVVRGDRFDIDHGIAVSSVDPDSTVRYPALESRGVLNVTATAKKDDNEPRTVQCSLNAGLPTCSGFKDGEVVTIAATRTLTIEGKEVSEVVASFELEAAALGLHYLPAGNRRAYYTTGSLVAVEWDDDTPGLTFAQTVGYSLYWKHRKARWVEGISAGAHFAVLGNPEDDPDEEEAPISFGIGGQLGLGQDAFQLGGGYDVLTRRPYFVIGIGIPDAVALANRLRKNK